MPDEVARLTRISPARSVCMIVTHQREVSEQVPTLVTHTHTHPLRYTPSDTTREKKAHRISRVGSAPCLARQLCVLPHATLTTSPSFIYGHVACISAALRRQPHPGRLRETGCCSPLTRVPRVQRSSSGKAFPLPQGNAVRVPYFLRLALAWHGNKGQPAPKLSGCLGCLLETVWHSSDEMLLKPPSCGPPCVTQHWRATNTNIGHRCP